MSDRPTTDKLIEATVLQVMAAVLFFAASTALAGALGELRLIDQARSWPTAHGVVTSLSYHTDPIERGDGPYLVDVTHDFTAANGLPYRGTTIGAGDAANTRFRDDDIATFERIYAVGTSVAVHYDPQEPGDCALSLATSDATKDELAFGAIGLAGAILIFALASWQWRRFASNGPSRASELA